MSNEERETKKREEGDEEKEESKEMGGKVLSTKTNNHQVNLPIVYASNKGRGELPTRHLPSRSTSVCN